MMLSIHHYEVFHDGGVVVVVYVNVVVVVVFAGHSIAIDVFGVVAVSET
jgi:hypothetical protein